MSHWRRWATEGAEFWISCKRPAFLSNFSRLQLIQNSAPFIARGRQCDIRIEFYLCSLPELMSELGPDQMIVMMKDQLQDLQAVRGCAKRILEAA